MKVVIESKWDEWMYVGNLVTAIAFVLVSGTLHNLLFNKPITFLIYPLFILGWVVGKYWICKSQIEEGKELAKQMKNEK